MENMIKTINIRGYSLIYELFDQLFQHPFDALQITKN